MVAAAIARKKNARKNILRVVAKIGKPFAFLPLYGLFRKVFYKFIVQKSDYIYQQGVMKKSYLDVIAKDLSPLLSDIAVPTIIFWGEQDDVIPVADAHFIHEKIKNSQLVLFSKGDHDLEQRIPEQLADKILTFLS